MALGRSTCCAGAPATTTCRSGDPAAYVDRCGSSAAARAVSSSSFTGPACWLSAHRCRAPVTAALNEAGESKG